MHRKMVTLLKQILVLVYLLTVGTCYAAGAHEQPAVTAESQSTTSLIPDSFNSPDRWRRPVTPFQLAGHSWYIGTEGLSAILIKTSEGAILIDGGLPGAA